MQPVFSGNDILLGVFGIATILGAAFFVLVFLPTRKRNRLVNEAVAFRGKKDHLETVKKLLAAYSIGVTWPWQNSMDCDKQKEILRYLIDSYEKLGKDAINLDGNSYAEKDVLKMVRDFGRRLIDKSLGKNITSEPPMRPITLKSVVCPICMNNLSRAHLVSRNKRWHCPVCDLPVYSHLPGGLDGNLF
ncbi:MAG TPA: hypothetical protein DCG57_06510 [Candidatus Riflebacteria bacterium]|jgi:hypothetical protein|nr:hypothetical protein [Candidatus Riflebacteria bacterium]